MKRLKQLMSGCFAVLVLVICATISIVSCDRFNRHSYEEEEVADSVYVAEYIDAVTNPTFGSVNQVLMFQGRFAEEASVDETFRTMPEEVLRNVATVCLKKYLSVTKKDIVLEYRINKEVYDNLPPNYKKSDTAMEEQQKPVVDTAGSKQILTPTREERSNEK